MVTINTVTTIVARRNRHLRDQEIDENRNIMRFRSHSDDSYDIRDSTHRYLSASSVIEVDWDLDYVAEYITCTSCVVGDGTNADSFVRQAITSSTSSNNIAHYFTTWSSSSVLQVRPVITHHLTNSYYDDDGSDDNDEYTNLCNLLFLLFLFIYSPP